MSLFRNFCSAILPLLCSFHFPLAAQIKSNHVQHDWPQSREPGILKTWPQGGPKVLWRVPLGEGYSSISIANGLAYTMHDEGNDE